MSTDHPTMYPDRALAAVARLRSDPGARETFERAYNGRGTASAALERVVSGGAPEPPTDEMLAHRRIAFGRTSSPLDEEAAARSLAALQAEDEAVLADAAALDSAISAVLELGPEASDPAGALEIPASVDAGRRRGGLPMVAAIAAALAIGAVAGSVITGERAAEAGRGVVELPAFPLDEPEMPESGGAAAAEQWFSSPQTADDAVPAEIPYMADGIDTDSMRRVHLGADGWVLWVARSDESEFCLMGYDPAENSGISTCAPAEAFEEVGAMMSDGQRSVTWNGDDLVLSLSD